MEKSTKYIKKYRSALAALCVAVGVAIIGGLTLPQTVHGQELNPEKYNTIDSTNTCPDGKFVKEDGTPCATSREIPLPANNDPSIVDKIINPFITLLTALIGIILAISLIVAAITYSAAAGDPNKVAAAKKRINNSIIALIAYIFAFGIIQWLVPGGLGA